MRSLWRFLRAMRDGLVAIASRTSVPDDIRHTIRASLIVAVGAVATTTAIPATAGTISGKINYLSIRDGAPGSTHEALAYVTFFGTRLNPPACATASYFMIRDAKSEGGKQQIAMLMTAKALGRAVAVTGADTCTRWTNGEDIFQIDWAE